MIVSIFLLIIGVLFTYQAVVIIYQYHFTDMLKFESYMIYMTTLVSNLINGIILAISSLVFFVNRQKGVLLYVFSGIMFMLYAINLSIMDIIVYRFDIFFILVSIITIFPFGLFLYLYFKKRRSFENINLKQEKTFIILSVIIYLLIDLIFYNWHPLKITGQI